MLVKMFFMLSLNSIALVSFVIAILAGTSFGFLQVSLELFLIFTLIIQTRKYQMTKGDIALVIIFLWTGIVSFFSLDLLTFILHLKIYVLFMLTYLACQNLAFTSKQDNLIAILINVNCVFIWLQTLFGFPAWIPRWIFAPYYQSQLELRPIGLFLVPHPSSFFLGIYAIYLFQSSTNKIKYFILLTCFATMSFTAALACSMQILMNNFNRKLNFLFYGGVLIFVVSYYFFKEEIIAVLMFSSYTRYYSVGPILDQIVNTYYWEYLFNIIPKSLDSVMTYSESMHGLLGTEVDFIRHAIQIGVIFLVASYFRVVSYLPNFSVFLFLSMLHYSYFYTMPFMLVLMFYFQRKVDEKY